MTAYAFQKSYQVYVWHIDVREIIHMYSPLRSVNYKLTTLTVTSSHVCKENKPEVATLNKNPNTYEQTGQILKRSSGNSNKFVTGDSGNVN